MSEEEGDPLAIALFSEVLALEGLVHARLTQALPRGMELSHFLVLNHLARLGRERSPAQLAKTLNVTKGAMTNTLSKLEVLGYVHIRPDWDDGRRKWVDLSASGLSARQSAVRAIAPLFEDVMAAVGADRVRQGLPFLRELRGVLD
ncbi:MAG: MarR family transcriptional regulator [Pseudomonadota bacterium]